MTREEEIREASINYQLAKRPMAIGGDAFADEVKELNTNPTFIKAAEWADKTMIEKVCKWLATNVWLYTSLEFLPDSDYPQGSVEIESLLKALKQAMKED